MPKPTASKKKNRRNRSREKNRRSRSQKVEKRKSRKNSPLLMNQKTHLRNEVEHSAKHCLAECSTKGGSAQDLRPNIHPIYHRHPAGCRYDILLILSKHHRRITGRNGSRGRRNSY